MIRKILFGTVVIIFLGVLAYAFFELRKGNIGRVDAIKAVPNDAAMIISAEDIAGLIRDELPRNPMWEELNVFPSIAGLRSRLAGLDTLLRSDNEISGLYRQADVLVSLHKSGKGNYEYMLYIPLSQAGNEKQIIRFVMERVPEGALISNRKYDDVRIYDITFPKHREKDNFSYTVSHGLFLLSPSSILLEDAIRQIGLQQSVADERGYREVSGTAGHNVSGNIYVNFKVFPGFISHLFRQRYAGRIEGMLQFSDWSELDVNLRHNAMLLNGFTWCDPESDDYLNIILKHQPQKLDIENVVPSSVAAFLALGFDDFQEYKKDYINYLEISGGGRSYLRDLRALNEKYNMDVDGLFLPVIDRQVAMVITDIRNSGWEENAFVICNTKSKSLAEEKLSEFLTRIGETDDIDISSLILHSRVNNDVNYTFYKVPVPFLPAKLFGQVFGEVNSKYCTFYDNCLIFGNSIQALSTYIYANQLGDNLGSNLYFSQFSDYLASRSNLYFYLDVPASAKVLERYLEPSLFRKIEKQEEHLDNFQALAYQLTSENNMAYNNIILKYTPELREEAKTVWESRLDRPVVTKPALVVNHYTKENEIFVQDADNNIYLMNSSGRILWKQKIEGRILSDIYQIDFYGNGKLQMMFNTKDQLHLIDRNGNYVERFPVKLRSPATNGMALFDYEDNMDYRIAVAGEDRGVYLYNKEGNLVGGWEFGKTESMVTKPVEYFRIGDRDYLVFADRLTCYILNRRGQTRVRVREHFPVAGNAGFTLEGNTPGTEPRLAVTDTMGHVHFIYFDGRSEQVDLGTFPGDHYFNYADLDGDGRMEYIFTDGTGMKVFDADRSREFTYTFRSEISQPPVIYRFSRGDLKIGVVSEERHEIYLLNADGTLYRGFPLRGSTLFSIGVFSGTDSKFNLIVGSDDNFLYNYSVQ